MNTEKHSARKNWKTWSKKKTTFVDNNTSASVRTNRVTRKQQTAKTEDTVYELWTYSHFICNSKVSANWKFKFSHPLNSLLWRANFAPLNLHFICCNVSCLCILLVTFGLWPVDISEWRNLKGRFLIAATCRTDRLFHMWSCSKDGWPSERVVPITVFASGR